MYTVSDVAELNTVVCILSRSSEPCSLTGAVAHVVRMQSDIVLNVQQLHHRAARDKTDFRAKGEATHTRQESREAEKHQGNNVFSHCCKLHRRV